MNVFSRQLHALLSVVKKRKEAGTFEVVTRKTGEVRNLSEEELYQDFAQD
jgi:hypothetical protein